MQTLLVTGGAGFIGSQFVQACLADGVGTDQSAPIVVLDRLTYAGHLATLDDAIATAARRLGVARETVQTRVRFVEGDIADRDLVAKLFAEFRFGRVVNFAAESHVDRSIASAAEFVETNVLGVFSLLDASLRDWGQRSPAEQERFRFVQVSTDEVFGQLGETGAFSETTAYAPSSPYSASKASGDHLARAWHHTYGLPVIITNCSNNYGPRQFPEKLIPHMIACALAGKPLPVYGDGRNVRDWIHVSDHVRGVALALSKGRPGQSYCFGGRSERRNIAVVEAICDELDRLRPRPGGGSYRQQITFVPDRKGHDWRYAIDDAKAESELGFRREFAGFEAGLSQTIRWYLENSAWIKTVTGSRT